MQTCLARPASPRANEPCPPDLKARSALPTSSATPSKSCALRRARKLVQNSLEPHDAADLEIASKEIAHEDGMLNEHRDEAFELRDARPFATRGPTTREGVGLKSGALLVREWNGRLERASLAASSAAAQARARSSAGKIASTPSPISFRTSPEFW